MYHYDIEQPNNLGNDGNDGVFHVPPRSFIIKEGWESHLCFSYTFFSPCSVFIIFKSWNMG